MSLINASVEIVGQELLDKSFTIQTTPLCLFFVSSSHLQGTHQWPYNVKESRQISTDQRALSGGRTVGEHSNIDEQM
jgi:hypothetical protein